MFAQKTRIPAWLQEQRVRKTRRWGWEGGLVRPSETCLCGTAQPRTGEGGMVTGRRCPPALTSARPIWLTRVKSLNLSKPVSSFVAQLSEKCLICEMTVRIKQDLQMMCLKTQATVFRSRSVWRPAFWRDLHGGLGGPRQYVICSFLLSAWLSVLVLPRSLPSYVCAHVCA